MSAFIDAYAALLKTQVALMKVGIATRRPFIFVPVADDGEFTRLKAVLGISAPPPAASLPNAAPVASDGTEGQAASVGGTRPGQRHPLRQIKPRRYLKCLNLVSLSLEDKVTNGPAAST